MEQGHNVFGYFYNPNIHPVQELYARLSEVVKFNDSLNIKGIYDEEYGLVDFVRKAAFREENRCTFCYADRIEKTAQIAKNGKFDAFTTSLLYSRFQKHDIIKEICESMAKRYGLGFFYDDFREGWKYGIEVSKNEGMYRQQYCGCIYSEEDRYRKQLSGIFNKLKDELKEAEEAGKVE